MNRFTKLAMLSLLAAAPLTFAQPASPGEAPNPSAAVPSRTARFGLRLAEETPTAVPSGALPPIPVPGEGDLRMSRRLLGHEAAFYFNEGQKEKAAYLGVSASPVTPALREQLRLPKGVGLLVDFVEPKSPAQEAGIKQYDVLHKLGDQLLINAHQFAVLVRTFKAGEEITLTVIRQGEPRQIKAKLVEKEVMALDEKSPWGAPPGPWENAAGAVVLVGGPPVSGTAGTYPSAEIPVLPRVPLMNRLFVNPAYPLDDMRGEIRWLDDQGVLSLSFGENGRHLLAKDKAGKVLFDGPIDTEEQRRSIPLGLREKVNHLEGAAIPRPTTQPLGNRLHTDVPGFGQPGVIHVREAAPLDGQKP